jgi:hypothetical protein
MLFVFFAFFCNHKIRATVRGGANSQRRSEKYDRGWVGRSFSVLSDTVVDEGLRGKFGYPSPVAGVGARMEFERA